MTPTPSKEISLQELVEKLAYLRDDETFRWWQDSAVAPDGSVHATDTYRVTMGQARRELGMSHPD